MSSFSSSASRDKFKSSKIAGDQTSRSRLLKSGIDIRKDKRNLNLLAKRVRLADSCSEDSKAIQHRNDSDFQSQVQAAISKVKNTQNAKCLEGLQSLRDSLCVNYTSEYGNSNVDTIQLVIDAGCISYLSNLLLSTNEKIRMEATWCLTNIASGIHDQTGSVITAIPNLIQILASDVDGDAIKEQVCWTVGNIAADCDEFRNILLANGCLFPLLKFLKNSITKLSEAAPLSMNVALPLATTQCARTSAWTISNLIRGSTAPDIFLQIGTEHEYIIFLIELLKFQDMQVTVEIVWFFAFFTAKDIESVMVIRKLGFIFKFLDMLRQQSMWLSTAMTQDTDKLAELQPLFIPVLRILGNLTSGELEWVGELLLDDTVLNFLCSILSRKNKNANQLSKVLQKEGLWVIANILCGSDQSRVRVASYSNTFGNILHDVIIDSFHSDEYECQKGALFALENGCCSNIQILDAVFVTGEQSKKSLQHLVRIMSMPTEPGITLSCIRLLESIYKATMTTTNKNNNGNTEQIWNYLCEDLNCLEVLENVQYTCTNESVSVSAQTILGQIYTTMDEYDDADANVNVNNTFQGNSFFSDRTNINASADINIDACRSESNMSRNGIGRGSQLTKPSWMT